MASAMLEDATSSFEDDELASMTTDDVVRASRLLDNEIRILKVSSLFSDSFYSFIALQFHHSIYDFYFSFVCF